MQAQTKYVQSLKTVEALQTEYGEALRSFQDESILYREEANHSFEENRLYVETYELWENLRSAPTVPPVLPPGLPAFEAGQYTRPRASFAPAPAPTPDTRYEEVALMTKDADNLTAPHHPSLSNMTLALIHIVHFARPSTTNHH